MSGRCVWSPAAGRVEVVVGAKRRAMERADGGWWRTEAPIAPEEGYAFALDGGDPLPDPRSRWQPSGVHGPSRPFDPSRFPWTDADWSPPPLETGLIYELHVGTFTPEGTFDGVIGRLDHLVELGVTHVELMPVAEFSGGRGWGYDGVDLFAAHHAYGGPDGLCRLVDACHARGLAVLLDVVYNHLGPEGNYLPRFGPYFTDRHQTAWGSALNLDGRDSDEVRRFLCDNAIFWLRDCHFDGLRIDAVHAIVDTSATHLLEELASEVAALERRLSRRLVLIAESDANDPRLVRGPAVGGFGLTASWNDDFHHAIHALLTGERSGYYADFGGLAELAKVLTDVFAYDGRYSAFRGRRHGRSAQGLSGSRFVGFVQNHDQVGNRAEGDRLGRLVSSGRLEIAAALLFTAPFVPLLFMGEEWAASTPFLYFTDHGDPDLGRAVRDGRRREFAAFGWDPERIPDPQARESFERSKLDWTELERPRHRRILAWYRSLAALRRASPELMNGRMDEVEVAIDERADWIRIERGRFTLVANLSPRTATIPLRPGRPEAILLASGEEPVLREGALALQRDAVVIFGESTSRPGEPVAQPTPTRARS
ncbi:MAG: malto-oligosyltrehalose trehalohydrolase [Myxococcota bacterium]